MKWRRRNGERRAAESAGACHPERAKRVEGSEPCAANTIQQIVAEAAGKTVAEAADDRIVVETTVRHRAIHQLRALRVNQ
jgi:hypothetical protein